MFANLENIYGKRKLATIEKATHAKFQSLEVPHAQHSSQKCMKCLLFIVMVAKMFGAPERDGRHFFNQVVSSITEDSVAWEETVDKQQSLMEPLAVLTPSAFLRISLHFSTFLCISLHFSAFHYISLHFSTFLYISLHFFTFLYISLQTCDAMQ